MIISQRLYWQDDDCYQNPRRAFAALCLFMCVCVGTLVTLTTRFSVADQPETVDFTRNEVRSLLEDGRTSTVKKRSEEAHSETRTVDGILAKQ